MEIKYRRYVIMESKEKKILILDDDEDILATIGAAVLNMEIQPFTLTTDLEKSAKSALKKLISQKYDLVITDYLMPHYTGGVAPSG